jgi:hypothetical protein
MKRLKNLIVIALSLLLVAGWTAIAVADETEGTEINEAEVEVEETTTDEMTAAETAEGEEGTEKAEDEGKAQEGTLATESTEVTEKVEDEVKAEETATEEAKEGASPAESEEATEKAAVRKSNSLKGELEVMAIGVDGIVARLSKMQESADKKEKKELPFDLADLEDKIVSLRSQSDVVLELNEAFIDKGKVHFEAWEKELEGLKSKSLRKKGEKRHERQAETFKKFQDTMAEIDTALGTFKSSLQEIADYLKYDLRPESVSEISSDINKMKRMGKDITDLISDARKDLKSLPVFEVID